MIKAKIVNSMIKTLDKGENRMKYNFDEVVDRKDTHSIKWDFTDRIFKGQDLLSLWVADMDFPCADPIIDTLHKRIDRKIFGYSSHDTSEYTSAVVNWMKKRYDWEIGERDILFSPGVVPALHQIINAFTHAGEKIIIQRPVYYPFTDVIENNGRRVINNALKLVQDKWVMDYEDLEEKVSDPQVTMLFLCSPHNPVGRVWTKEELIKLGEICTKNNVLVICDEIHGDLVRRGIKHIPFASINDTFKQNSITCTAPSKTFNLAGMNLANIIISNKQLKNKWIFETKKKHALPNPNPLSIVALIAAYNDGEEWLEQAINYIDENLKYIDEFLKVNLPKAKYSIPEGTYLAWIDLRAYELSHKELESLMINEAKLALDEGYIFGEEGIGFERINAACPRSILEEALKRMAKVING